MKPHNIFGRHIFLSPSPSPTPTQSLPLPPRFNFKHATHPTIRCSSSNVPSPSSSSQLMETQAVKSEYKPNLMDDMFLTLFRNKMVKEVGWDSGKPGYDGLIEVANQLMIRSPNNAQAAESAVRILVSLFPPFLPQLFKMLIAPLANGKPAAIMVARVTQLSCQWLMGTCKVNSIQLQDGSSWETGVLVEKCKYLEESKCVGICINTCKLPTQTFIKDYMGVPLVMEPDFSDYSCQFKFGVLPPIPTEDKALSEPCLEICPNATRRRELNKTGEMMKCPKV